MIKILLLDIASDTSKNVVKIADIIVAWSHFQNNETMQQLYLTTYSEKTQFFPVFSRMVSISSIVNESIVAI